VGERVEGAGLTTEGRTAEHDRLVRELARLHELVESGAFPHREPRIGTEVELDLVDGAGAPALVADRVLAAIARDDPGLDAQSELARYNLELNLPARPFGAGCLDAIERDLADGLARAAHAAEGIASPIAVGILPTLGREHTEAAVISTGGRYRLLDESVRGDRTSIPLDIAGADATGGQRLTMALPSIAIEAAATSLQVHLDTPIGRFARTLNAAQALAAAEIALSANSPLLCGMPLWHETRIALFEQVIDLRDGDGRARGERPRVWFGDRWHERATDPFDENVRLFEPILPQRAGEDADATVDGDAPELAALRLHNGTVWRWNRPVYAVIGGAPSLRLENRVMAAGPTAVDMAANVAVLVGAVHALAAGLAEDLVGGELEDRLAFTDAAASFRSAARDGLDAVVVWPGLERPSAARVVLEVMLPAAERGLADAGVPTAERTRLLDVVAGRAASGRTGAAWQLATLRRLESEHDRPRALGRLTLRYLELQREGAPVHTWPMP
jgi:gamma-glutamyl:cysteine ligase YbdK (ATP-grasp superfamily)